MAWSSILHCQTSRWCTSLASVSRTARIGRSPEDSKPEYTTEDFPIFYRFGWAGIDSPEFRAASIAAYRYVGMETLVEQYENYRPNGSSFILSA